MAIARRLNFNVPPLVLLQTQPLGFLYFIKRFDRTDAGKLLKEDAAQLLDIMSEDKYLGSMEKVAKILTRVTTNLDLNDFFRRLMFCFVSGNGDMHLKNWAILKSQDMNGTSRLSPCYDLLNTRLPIPREQLDIALPIAGKQRKLQASYFRKFALENLQLAAKYVDSVFAELEEWKIMFTEMVPRSALTEDSKEQYLKIVEERFNMLRE